ncbi:hypothetical protein [Maridesulfovibrio sp.]|uniref:hypothetical protein n=1 Tax=Maridesulfovibrio sp. TaxID=2795000 RepID=UPI002A186D83|nr:hypothetical protein [Maridesulfovibrio sp.]
MSKKQVSDYDFDGTWEYSPFGMVLMQRDFFCIRCGKVERFSIAKKELKAIKYEDDASDALVVRKLLGAGWIFTSSFIDRKPQEYILCPDCVQADITRFNNHQHVYASLYSQRYTIAEPDHADSIAEFTDLLNKQLRETDEQ